MVGLWLLTAMCALHLAGALTNFAGVPCGRSLASRRTGKIVGGLAANPGEFPWIVSLKRHGGHFCGGTIIHEQWIVTAAHCLCNGPSPLSASQINVTLKEHDLSRPSISTVPVRRIMFHPSHSCSSFNNDIALLELTRSIQWSDLIRPACLPSGSLDYSEQRVTVAGWGWTNENPSQGRRSNILQKVALSVVSNQVCQAWYQSEGKKINVKESQMCAGHEQGGKDACWADSGGPLMLLGAESTQVIGLVSTGIGCARPRLPGLYTRLTRYIRWISDTLDIH
ncbi:hypothetical protein M8J77_004050 [Diaphorina citri]|nr:hypothetical protein M8J77_004050 [Diaphorina citri]